MAAIWWEAFQAVAEAGFLIDPIDTGLGADDTSTTCMPSASGFGSVITTMGNNFGYNDGPYAHESELTMKNWVLYNQAFNHSMLDYNQFHFAEITKWGNPNNLHDELILIMDPADREFANANGDHIFSYFNYLPNNGDPYYYMDDATISWQDVDIVGQGTPECLSRGVRFGDINGDGLDDFICLNEVSPVFPCFKCLDD